MKINKENKKLLKRFRWGIEKERLTILIVMFLFYFFFSLSFIFDLESINKNTNLFPTSVLLFVVKLGILSFFISLISVERQDLPVIKFLILPFILAEPLFFLNLKSLNYIKNINLEFITVGSIITIILLFIFSSYLKRTNTINKLSYRVSRIYQWGAVLFSAVIITVVMQAFSSQGSSLYEIFWTKEIVLSFLVIVLFFGFFRQTKDLFKKSINLLSRDEKPDHGDIIYFKGKNLLLKEKTSTRSFLHYTFTEKMFLYQVSEGNKKYDVYIESGIKNPFISQLIFPGNEVEVFGRYIKLEIDDKPVQFIYPIRINNFSKVKRKERTKYNFKSKENLLSYKKSKNKQ